MKKSRSIPSILIAVGSLLSFFLPFVTVSCGSKTVLTFTGHQLATGANISQQLSNQNVSGLTQNQKLDPDPTAIVGEGCAVIGLVLCCIGKRFARASAVTSSIGVIALFMLRSKLREHLEMNGSQIAAIHYSRGFLFAILFFFAGAVWNGILYFQAERAAAAAPQAKSRS